MLPDRVSNPGPLTYESGALPIALRGPAFLTRVRVTHFTHSLYTEWDFFLSINRKKIRLFPSAFMRTNF